MTEIKTAEYICIAKYYCLMFLVKYYLATLGLEAAL